MKNKQKNYALLLIVINCLCYILLINIEIFGSSNPMKEDLTKLLLIYSFCQSECIFHLEISKKKIIIISFFFSSLFLTIPFLLDQIETNFNSFLFISFPLVTLIINVLISIVSKKVHALILSFLVFTNNELLKELNIFDVLYTTIFALISIVWIYFSFVLL